MLERLLLHAPVFDGEGGGAGGGPWCRLLAAGNGCDKH